MDDRTVISGSPEDKRRREEAVDLAVRDAKRAVMKPCFTVDQSLAIRNALDEISRAIKRAI